MIRFQRETASEIIDEIIPLTKAHYDQVARFKDIPLDPDFETYVRADEMGILRVYTARKNEGLVGYALFFLRHHPHYRKSLQAFSTLLFMHPKSRGHSMSFIRFCDEALKTEGVEVVSHTVTTQMDYSKVLERLHYEPAELIFTRRL